MTARTQEDFIGLKKFPGYFWHRTEKRLYSLKVQGFLRPLALQDNAWAKRNVAHIDGPYYYVSKRGRSMALTIPQILNLLEADHVIPVVGEFKH